MYNKAFSLHISFHATMNTQLLSANDYSIQCAANLLKNGEIVAFPTETVYGLGAHIFLESAIKKIFDAKHRPTDNPLIAHIATIDQVDLIAQNIPSMFYTLAEAFFPGPLSLVVPKKSTVPLIATAGQPTISIRMPNHPVAKDIIRHVGSPIVAPSANRSGLPSPTKAEHVLDDLRGIIPLVIDGGPCEIGIESTILDITQDPPVILRPGHITKEQLERVIGTVQEYAYEASIKIPKAPGMKYRHYAPNIPITIYYEIDDLMEKLCAQRDKRIFIFSNMPLPKSELSISTTPIHTSTIFDYFRFAEKEGYDEIFIFIDEETKKHQGLMNRIQKAAKRE